MAAYDPQGCWKCTALRLADIPFKVVDAHAAGLVDELPTHGARELPLVTTSTGEG
ncbi:hypothetical protein [Microbacterium sp. AG790]|uniref:hypothetical protein n=1 Tax=Microbacterium sp. AG790 TaxID=2183995 RepID=UPI00217D24D9|nr:hypothetical protein [Microbacterium sp. AG790]